METVKLDKNKLWLVTGAAGFIGSHLVEQLVKQGQKVRAVDNFITGHKKNLAHINPTQFEFIQGDICDFELCKTITKDVDIVLHQAALGSVPGSIEDPFSTHKNNVDGSLNLLVACKENGVKRFVYASSSSVYGDEPTLPKLEKNVGLPLSPYALSKKILEEYAELFFRAYGIETIGLRYFNVYGARQDPNGAYAAVIPRWIESLKNEKSPEVYGDGRQSRDFCFISNVVQANLLAATTVNARAFGMNLNIALGQQTNLLELFRLMKQSFIELGYKVKDVKLTHKEIRKGDIVHSLASIDLAKQYLNFNPQIQVNEGLRETILHYIKSKNTL